MQFNIKGQEYFLAFIDQEKRWYLFAPTGAGVNRIPVYVDAVKYDRLGHAGKRNKFVIVGSCMKGHSERGKSRRSPNILMLNMTSQGISTTAAGRGWLAALLLALDYKRSFDSLPFAAANGSFAQDDKA